MKYARDFRHEALDGLSGRWGLAVLTGFLAFLLGGSFGFFTNKTGPNIEFRFSENRLNYILSPVVISTAVFFGIIALILFIINGAVQLGYIQFNLNLLGGNNRRKPSVSDLFIRFRIIWKALLLNLAMGLFIFLWTLLLIIPGIIASYSYAMAPYLLSENPNMKVLEALRQSKQMMRGNRWRLFCLQISFIGWAFLSIFTCGIGFLWLIPYSHLASAAFYNEISGNNQRYYGTPQPAFDHLSTAGPSSAYRSE